MPCLALSLPEREEISVALIENRDVTWTEIGLRVDRHRTTIAREVTAHGGRDHYRPSVAQCVADRARLRPRECRLAVGGVLRDRVTTELRQGRSPEAIWADLVADDVTDRVCVETIYQAVYGRVVDVKATECLRSRRRRRRCRQTRKPNRRAGFPNIKARTAAVNDRTEAGHWEIDQIIGKANQSSMIWLSERVSRFSIPVTMPCGYTAEATLGGLIEGLDQIPKHLLRSITFDQGSEWALWETVADHYKIDVWFCDPHSPWQRGQIENLNRQWRWWFPRGMRLDNIAPARAQHAANIINGQRRRKLAYQSPATLYTALTVQR